MSKGTNIFAIVMVCNAVLLSGVMNPSVTIQHKGSNHKKYSKLELVILSSETRRVVLEAFQW